MNFKDIFAYFEGGVVKYWAPLLNIEPIIIIIIILKKFSYQSQRLFLVPSENVTTVEAPQISRFWVLPPGCDGVAAA